MSEFDRQILAFLKARPHYSESHVREIADMSNRSDVPFCDECSDWHDTEDACSADPSEC